MTNSLQKRLYQERELKQIFAQANIYGSTYLDDIVERSVCPTETSIKNLKAFDEQFPEQGENAEQVLEQLDKFGSPATSAIQGGRYYGFVNGSSLPVSLAARILGDYWDQNAALHVISPVASKLETVCETWLNDLLGLPDNVVAGYVTGTSVAILCGLAAGRYRLLLNQGWDVNKQGLYGAPKLRLIASRQAHGTVLKAISLLGLGLDSIEWVDTDDQGRILVDQVPELDDRCLLLMQAGNVCSGCFEDFDALIPKARDVGAWVHVDGAFGLWAAGCGTLKHLTAGMEAAHSFSVDGHKTLNLPYDNGIVLCADSEALTNALHNSGSYVVLSEERDGMFYVPEMSRRARAIELWAALKYLGRAGVDALVLGLHEKAKAIAKGLKQLGFSIVNDVVFNQVLVQCETDQLTDNVMTLVQQSGECWLGGADWMGRRVMRVSVCSWMTTDDDVARTVKAFSKANDAARSSK